jgi:hypothetical protein
MERLESAIRRHIQLVGVGDLLIDHDHVKRLIDWNNDLLSRQLKVIVARRMASPSGPPPARPPPFVNKDVASGNNPRDEYAKSITLPRFDPKSVNSLDPDRIELEAIVQEQLIDLITSIAKSYNENPFHNFEVSAERISCWQSDVLL